MYESLMASLTEEVNDIKKYGKPQGRKTTLEITPVTRYTAAKVKSVRMKTGNTQEIFATCLGVSKKTVEKWEDGTNEPSGPASRMLDLIEDGTITSSKYIINPKR